VCELVVLELFDNGKFIKEMCDVDVFFVVVWFFYYVGWVDKLDYVGLGLNFCLFGVVG